MKRLDLNLLVIFDAIIVENSIVGAAKRLNMTQPAVSNAVTRMRHLFNNPLFIKHGRGIVPNAYALSLWNQIHQPMNDIQEAVNPEIFTPASIKRRFRVALPDLIVDLVWLPLRKIIEKEAPYIDILAIPLPLKDRMTILKDGKADLVICLSKYLATSDRKNDIIKPRFVCAMRKDHQLSKGILTIENFLSAEHLLVTSAGDDRSYVDELLSNKGLTRRVAMTVNHYAVIAKLLASTNLITVVDALAVAHQVNEGSLISIEPPLDIEDLSLCIAWHARHDRDKMIHWLKDKLIDLVKQEYNAC
ncbi:MAG: LysR family transcriptional regulator [Colwellia sp.]|nr:LysR family transcriptional regulator [Colwellia sp.]